MHATSRQEHEPLFVSRQAIYPPGGGIWGYRLELYSRTPGRVAQNRYAGSAKLVVDGVTALPREPMDSFNVVVPFPGKMIKRMAPLSLPPERTIVEVSETVPPGGDILAACHDLQESGFRIALPFMDRLYAYSHLLRLADYVVFPVGDRPREEGMKLSAEVGEGRFQILAVNVDGHEELRQALDMGSTLLCGSRFSELVKSEERGLTTAQMTRLRIIREIYRDDWEVDKVVDLFRADPVLSFRLLAYLNSAWFGFSEKVDDISKALMLLGKRRLKHWLLLVILADMIPAGGDEELLCLAAVRGRFLEMLAQDLDDPALPRGRMFLFGAFSLLDALVSAPMCELVEHLPLDEEVKEALCDHGKPLFVWIRLASALERGDWDSLERHIELLGLDRGLTAERHAKALIWVENMLRLNADNVSSSPD